MLHLDLFSGIGGFHLAAEWAGFQTIGFSEIEPYCCQLLAEKWPGIKNYGDIRTADFSGLQGNVTILSAGVPCQPASLAGKRRGKDDDRWLWEATLDVVRTVEPAWCLFENPPGILTLDEFAGVLLRLESLGYQIRAFSVPANAVGAKHRRQRVFIVANTGCEVIRERAGLCASEPGGERRRRSDDENSQAVAHAGSGGFQRCVTGSGFAEQRAKRASFIERSGQESEALADAECQRREHARTAESEASLRRQSSDANSEAVAHASGSKRETGIIERSVPPRSKQWSESFINEPSRTSEALADADRAGLEEHKSRDQRQLAPIVRSSGPLRFRLTEPPLCLRIDGIRGRSHQLKALGNAVVPQQVYPFFAAIAQIEKNLAPPK